MPAHPRADAADEHDVTLSMIVVTQPFDVGFRAGDLLNVAQEGLLPDLRFLLRDAIQKPARPEDVQQDVIEVIVKNSAGGCRSMDLIF